MRFFVRSKAVLIICWMFAGTSLLFSTANAQFNLINPRGNFNAAGNLLASSVNVTTAGGVAVPNNTPFMVTFCNPAGAVVGTLNVSSNAGVIALPPPLGAQAPGSTIKISDGAITRTLMWNNTSYVWQFLGGDAQEFHLGSVHRQGTLGAVWRPSNGFQGGLVADSESVAVALASAELNLNYTPVSTGLDVTLGTGSFFHLADDTYLNFEPEAAFGTIASDTSPTAFNLSGIGLQGTIQPNGVDALITGTTSFAANAFHVGPAIVVPAPSSLAAALLGITPCVIFCLRRRKAQ